MAFGTTQPGTATRIYVGTSAPPATLVGGLVSWDYPSDRDTEETEFENTYPSVTSVGSVKKSITLNLKYAKGDTGQDVLKANHDLITPTIIYCSVLVDTTTGEYLPGVVSSYRLSSSGARSLTDLVVVISQQGDPVDIAGGL